MNKIILPDKPQVLLLGNSLNLSYGGILWKNLLKKISERDDLPEHLDCPYPLQAILVSNDHVKTKMKENKNDFFGKAPKELQAHLQCLLDAGFDDILTTNYSYELEAASLSSEKPSENILKKSYHNVIEGHKAEPKYMLSSCYFMPFKDKENRIWHIHGEARKPDSMILGHYYYANLLSKLEEYIKGRKNNYLKAQQNQQPQILNSWLDSFILGDVYILGLGLDLSEIDLWWLLNRKKRENAETGKVYFYEPASGSFNEKIELLKLMGVEHIHLGYTLPENEEEKKQFFKEFNTKAIQDICQRVKDNKKS